MLKQRLRDELELRVKTNVDVDVEVGVWDCGSD